VTFELARMGVGVIEEDVVCFKFKCSVAHTVKVLVVTLATSPKGLSFDVLCQRTKIQINKQAFVEEKEAIYTCQAVFCTAPQ
jgi:hypothetical protein